MTKILIEEATVKLALQALGNSEQLTPDVSLIAQCREAISAIKQAPEQPAVQEPVARIAELEETVRQLNHALREATEAPTFMGEPVVAAPAARIKGFDEYGPLLEWNKHWVNFSVGTRLYTTQPAALAAPVPTNCRHCGGPDNVLCGGQCKAAQPAPADTDLMACWVEKPDGTIDGIASMRLALSKYGTAAQPAQPAVEPFALLAEWAATSRTRFVSRSHGMQTTDTVSRDDLMQLICAARAAPEAPVPQPAPELKPVEFGMHGKKMMFKVGVQQFTLDHEPDTQDEFNFMRDMLVHAFSTFTPDVKTTQPAPARPAVPLTDELSNAVQMACQLSFKDHGRRSVNEQAWQRLMQAVAAYTHGITEKGQQ